MAYVSEKSPGLRPLH